MTRRAPLFLLLVGLVCWGCVTPSPAAEGTLPGLWKYTLIDASGNTYDKGTMEFAGSTDTGTWTQTNFYKIEYTGRYTFEAGEYVFSGSETWKGHFRGPQRIEGTWSNESGDGGTLTLTR